MLRWHVVSAVFWRNLKQYFSGPLGYVFIVIFVTVCAIMAFSQQFFANNLATLDQLSEYYPLLLLSIIPAITMTVWADEKRQGTDAILFTLPASDLDILLGKFFSVVAIYTIALGFSVTQVIVLGVLGEPDWGVIFTTYLGYWLAGVALLSIGMFASSLTDNATIAFVLGAILCAIPILIGQYYFGLVYVERFGFAWHLRDFTLGVIPLVSVVYFLAITIFMLYLNLIMISQRHWSRGQHAMMTSHFLVRGAALLVALVAMVTLSSTAVSSSWSRADFTTEGLFTLDQVTLDTLKKVKDDQRAVTIQAFISREVPRKYVDAKKKFIGLLREFNEFGDRNVEVRFVDVTPNSEAALNAKRSGILPRDDRSVIGGKTLETEVYLGALISTSIGDSTVPFVDEGMAIEYELSRALATTIDKKNRISVGILETDAFFGGPTFEGRRVPWSYNRTLETLKQQFDLKFLTANDLSRYLKQDPAGTDADSADSAEPTKQPTPPDVLIVADPSSLDDMGMDNLVNYVQSGNPTLVLADPLPFFWAFQNPRDLGVLNAPRMGRVSPRSPYGQILASSPMPKSDNGSAAKLFNALGLQWDSGTAAWSSDNPHQSFSGRWSQSLGARWPELFGPYEKAFVWARDHGDVVTFNPESSITAGLGEMLLFYPGAIKQANDSELEFTPLITLGPESGLTEWEELTITPKQERQVLDPRTGTISTTRTAARSQITANDLVVLNPAPATIVDEDRHILAARVTGGENSVDVVVITDMDFVSELYYSQEEALNQENSDRLKQRLDNLAFFQNAIEVLAGNDSFVKLRNRRAKPRTLTMMEKVINEFRQTTAREIEQAEEAAQKELTAEQDKLKKANAGVQANENLNFFEKIQRTGQQTLDAQRRFELKKQRIDRQLDVKLDELKASEQERITQLEARTRYLSIFLAPLPALVLGVLVLWFRRISEERSIESDRRV